MKTKLIHVISDTNIGGAGKYLLTFLNGFNREKFEAIVVIPFNSKLKPEIEKLNVKVIEAEHIADKSYSSKAVGTLKDIFKFYLDKGKMIVHTHGCLSARIAAAKLKFWHKNVKIVFTRHSVFEPTAKMKRGIRKALNKTFNKLTSDKIIAVANAAKKNLTDTGVPSNLIQVIYNGVPPVKRIPDEEKIELCRRLGIRKELTIVLMAARLTAVKGQSYVIQAAKKFIGKAEFLIAGTGEDEGKLREMAKDAPNVHMLGFVDNMEEIMNITDIQINASFGTEAASLALLEGMSLGIPAIATDYGGNPELIINNKNGFVIRQKSSTAIEDSIDIMIHRTDLFNKMERGALDYYSKHFTDKIMIERMQELYEEI